MPLRAVPLEKKVVALDAVDHSSSPFSTPYMPPAKVAIQRHQHPLSDPRFVDNNYLLAKPGARSSARTEKSKGRPWSATRRCPWPPRVGHPLPVCMP
jgi:hypothetical protein